MGKLVDISGQRFGKLTCLEMVGRKNGHVQWKFACDCGTVITTRGGDVRQGKTTSCGCYRNERTIQASKGLTSKERKRIKQERLEREKRSSD